MMTRTKRSYLQLVVNRDHEDSRNSATTLDRQISETKFAVAQRLNLPSTPFRELAVPHADRLSGDAESVSQGLVSTAEVVDDLLKRDLGLRHDASVSTLPSRVKRLTSSIKKAGGKLTYMGKRRVPTDAWAIQRGQLMRAARAELGLSQAKVAAYAGVKDRETIAQYESGLIADIDPSVIPKLAIALGMSPQQLSRLPWNGRDDAADLRVSAVAKQIAYQFDHYPLPLQNQIRAAIAAYEAMSKVQVTAETRPVETTLPPKRRSGTR